MKKYLPTAAVVLATHNKGKAREFAELLTPFHLEVLSLDAFPEIAEVEETGVTFAENALLKARAISKASGLVALADDSGLEVDALGGAPGVYSARYSLDQGSGNQDKSGIDKRNTEKVLHNLAGVPLEKRTARFRCVMAAATPDGDILTTDGSWEGRILEAPLGENGFGYDPVFFDPTSGKTAAQMEKAEKNAKSHRAKAVQKMLTLWPDFWHAWIVKNC